MNWNEVSIHTTLNSSLESATPGQGKTGVGQDVQIATETVALEKLQSQKRESLLPSELQLILYPSAFCLLPFAFILLPSAFILLRSR